MDDEGIYPYTYCINRSFIHIYSAYYKYNIYAYVHIYLMYLYTFLFNIPSTYLPFTIDEFSYDHYYSNLLFIMTYRHIGTIIITKYVQNVVELEASARSNWTTLLCCTRFGSLCSLFRTKRLMLCVVRCIYRKKFDFNNKISDFG